MAEEYNQSIKVVVGGGLLIILGTLASKVAGFLRQFIIIRLLTPEQYGLFALGLAFLNTLAPLGNLGYYIGAQRFIAFHEARGEYAEVRGTVRSTIRLVVISGISIFIVLYLASGKISGFLDKPDFKIPLMLFSALVPISIMTNIITSFFWGFKRADLSVIVNHFTFSVMSVLLILIGLLVKRELVYAIAGFSISYLLVLTLGIYLFRRHIYIKLKEFKPAPIAGKLFRFSLPLFFTGVSSIILNQTDTLMLGYFAASESVGFYNAAFVLSIFIEIFLHSLGTMFMPVLTGLVAKGKKREAKGLYQAVTRWLFILTLPLLLTFFLFPSRVLSLVFSSPYAQAGLCLAILSISEFLNTFLGPNHQALTAFGETKILLVSWSTAAVSNIIMNYFFIQRWGMNGAAAATGISLVILNFINSTFLYGKHKVHPFGRKYIVPVVLCFGTAALLYLPLRALVERSNWFVLTCYPLFLAIGIALTMLTRSVSEEDLLVYRALRARLRGLVKR